MMKNVIDRITELMVEFPRLMHRRMAKECREESKVNILQIHALVFLRENQGATMSALARVLQVSSPSATSFVNRLVKMGWITRVSDPQNRKLVRLQVTPVGEKALADKLHARNRVIAGILVALDETERLEFERLLKKILTSARDSVTI